MPSEKNHFALGLQGAIALGIPKWSENFTTWVTHEEFQVIYEEFWRSYLKCLETFPEDATGSLKTRVKLVICFSLVVRTDIAYQRAVRSGAQPAIPEEYENLIAAFDNNGDLDLKRARNRRQTHSPFKSLLRSLFHAGKAIVKRKRFPGSEWIVNLGPPDLLKDEYIRQKSWFDWRKKPEDFLGRETPPLPEKIREAENLVDQFLREPIQVLEARFGPLSEKTKIYLKVRTEENLLYYAEAFRAAKEQLRKSRHKILISSNVGNPLNRCVLLANQAIGKHSIGVTHGNNIGISYYPYVFWHELSAANELIFPHEKAKTHAEQLIRNRKNLPQLNTKISFVQSDYFRYYVEKLRALPPPEKVRTVMVIGFPFNDLTYVDVPCGSTLVQLDLEYRVLKALHGKFRVIYKAHPDRLAEIRNGKIWGDLPDFVETRPFETVMDGVDAFVFPQVSSTTFFVSLLSNRPVIYFDTGTEYFLPQANAALKNRAVALPAKYAPSGRVEFRDEDLLNALSDNAPRNHSEFAKIFILR